MQQTTQPTEPTRVDDDNGLVEQSVSETASTEKEENEATENKVSDVDDSNVDDNSSAAHGNLPTLSNLLSISSLDSRVGHYILDLLSGVDPTEAFSAHFTMPGQEQQTAQIEMLVAEAEQRGYLRGRNEKITLEMKQPAGISSSRDEDSVDCTGDFLASRRRSVWD